MAETSIENCLLNEIYKTSSPEQDLHVYEVQSRNNVRDTEGKFVAQTGTGIWDWGKQRKGPTTPVHVFSTRKSREASLSCIVPLADMQATFTDFCCFEKVGGNLVTLLGRYLRIRYTRW